jgi:type IV pilus assembly protein PilW
MLVAAALALFLTGAAAGLAFSARRTHDGDRARTRLNQCLRAGRELVVNDVRQAGERLDANFPALVLVRGEDLPGGAAGDPDELTIRRNLSQTVLRVCADLAVGDDEVVVAVKTGVPPPGCAPLPIDPPDPFPTNLQAWSEERLGEGGSVPAYVYDPVTGSGEFFSFSGEGENTDAFFLEKPAGSPAWQQPCPAAHGCRLYLLEEHRFRVAGELLQIVEDGDLAAPINLVDSIVDFQVRVRPKPTPADPTPAPLETFAGADWRELAAVELTLAGRASAGARTFERAWTIEVTPRNVL